jgi:hypothetical protein
MPTEINRVTRCVIEGRDVIAAQCELIETLKLERMSTEAAEQTLAQLKRSHALFEDRLQRLTSDKILAFLASGDSQRDHTRVASVGLIAMLRALLRSLSLGQARSPRAAALGG